MMLGPLLADIDPLGVRPEMAPYTVYVDAISKSFAATGVRVGWVAGPHLWRRDERTGPQTSRARGCRSGPLRG